MVAFGCTRTPRFRGTVCRKDMKTGPILADITMYEGDGLLITGDYLDDVNGVTLEYQRQTRELDPHAVLIFRRCIPRKNISPKSSGGGSGNKKKKKNVKGSVTRKRKKKKKKAKRVLSSSSLVSGAGTTLSRAEIYDRMLRVFKTKSAKEKIDSDGDIRKLFMTCSNQSKATANNKGGAVALTQFRDCVRELWESTMPKDQPWEEEEDDDDDDDARQQVPDVVMPEEDDEGDEGESLSLCICVYFRPVITHTHSLSLSQTLPPSW